MESSLFRRQLSQPVGNADIAASTALELHELEKAEGRSMDGSLDRSVDAEKPAPELAIRDSSTDVNNDDEEHPDDVRLLPPMIRAIVSLEDDPNSLTMTFRYFLLCLLFVPPGAFMFQLCQYRTTAAIFPVLFVQIGSHYLGHWLARVLPEKRIWVPLTRFSFSLNPGPWNVKENVLVTLTAASGATSNAAWSSISIAEVYYHTRIPALVAILFMFAIVFLGYGIAALSRQFLLYDPIYPWPYALMQTALFETLRKSPRDSWIARRQRQVFFAALFSIIAWTFLPQYAFPMLTSLSVLCWVAPRSPVANFVGSGLGGMGFLSFTLDWANVSSFVMSNPMVAPFWTTVIGSVAYVLSCWILLPWAKWGNLGTQTDNKHFTHESLMSNKLFLANGTRYPVTNLVTRDWRFNDTAYDELGPIYMGTHFLWSTFFEYSTYMSAITWMLLFGWSNIRDTYRQLRRRARGHGRSLHDFYEDRLNVLMRAYEEIPLWWFISLILGSSIVILVILAHGYFFMPVWTFFIAVLSAGILTMPMAWLFALSSFQISVGTMNELIYGGLVNLGRGHRHPAGASAYGALAGDIWYRAQFMLQDQKIGHYMHIPPRLVFFSQIFGELIGIPINYGVIRWVNRVKGQYLTGTLTDPLHQWTGQQLVTYNSQAIQYVLIGPKRLFSQAMFSPIPWGFLYGALAPVLIYGLHRAFPQSPLKFRLWNVTIFGAAMGIFYGNSSAGYISRFVCGYISMYYFYRKRFETWRRYNFLVAASLDAGFNIAIMLIFFFFQSGKFIAMPEWWGNSSDANGDASVDRCFALKDA